MRQDLDTGQIRIANVAEHAIDRAKDGKVQTFVVLIDTNMQSRAFIFQLVVDHGDGDRSKSVIAIVTVQWTGRRPVGQFQWLALALGRFDA